VLRGILFILLVWIGVTVGIYVFYHLPGRVKKTLLRSALFGLVTAVIALVFVVALVYLF